MKRRLAMVPAFAALLVVVITVTPVSALDEADRLFMVGERALADRFHPVARRTLERFVTQYPKDARLPRAELMLGKARLALNDPQSALEAFTRASSGLTAPADLLEVKLWQAEALVELKRASEAQPLLTTFATKYPSSKLVPDAQFLLGWIKMNNGDQRGGAADLRAFVTANPNHEQAPEARRLITAALGKYGDRDEQLASYNTLMSQDPPTADGLYEAVKIATRLSRPKDADAAWRKLKGQFPEHAATRRLALELANAAFKQKNYKDAGALGLTAAHSDENSVRAEGWLIVGESELKLKRFPQAAKAFEAVGAVGDVEAGVRYRALAGLGLAREEQKEWKAALAAYEAVAGRSPDPTLRDWARERVTAMKNQLKPGNNGAPPPKRSEPAKPSDKPAGRK